MSSIPDPTDLANPDVVRLRKRWVEDLASVPIEKLRLEVSCWIPRDDWTLSDYVALRVGKEILDAHDNKDRWWT